MERLRELGGFDDDLRIEAQKGDARLGKATLDPHSDWPVEL